MRILVTGCEGMLGRAVMARFAADHHVQGVDLKDGDLAAAQVARSLIGGIRPDWVVNCAAWTAVDAAESRREEALAANVTLVARLAAACSEAQAGLSHISTDYVFDGEGSEGFAEDSPRAPVSHYGQTKALGEEAVERADCPWQIVRTSWLFGDGPVNFVKTIAGLLQEERTLKVVADQQGSPTYAADLAEVLSFLVSGRHHGIFHATNFGICTWFEFARAIAAATGHDPERIQPCATSEYLTAARRPACSVLRSSRLEEVGCPPRPAWRDALGRYLDLLKSGRAKYP